MSRADDLLAEAVAIRTLGAEVVNATDIGTFAIELAVNNWKVGPLCHRDKETGRILHPHGKDPVGHLVPHGVLDFTTEVNKVANWWARAPWNIGARVPDPLFVLDVDDLDVLNELLRRYGLLPETLTTISGRAAGGKHFYFRRPAAKLSQKRLPKGLQIKTSTGYTVQPPSIHPHSGKQYTRIEAPVAAPPAWLVELLLPERTSPRQPRRHLYPLPTGPSIADNYSSSTSWAQILQPHGWRCLDADPDADGARWLHPTHTSNCSATIKNSCLFVYSPNTPFDVTEPGYPKGYTRFRAHAILDHNGDLKAAARALKEALH